MGTPDFIIIIIFFLVCNSHRVKIFLQRLGKRENNNIMWTSRENRSQYICMEGQNGGGGTKKKKKDGENSKFNVLLFGS